MNESITEFVCHLRRLACNCNFGDKATEMLHDIFVVGMRDDRLGEQLLSKDATTLTFEDAIKCAEAFEHVRAECNHSQVISAVQAPAQSGRDKLSRDSLVKNNKKVGRFMTKLLLLHSVFGVDQVDIWQIPHHAVLELYNVETARKWVILKSM